MLASLIVASLLARNFFKPIRNLRSTFWAEITANIDVHLGSVMGQRSDELVDIGYHLDLMAI